MARTVRDTKLDTRSARLKLAPRREPYWRKLTEGLAVGYRRGERGGTWIARAYLPERTPARCYEALGAADDTLDADGAAVLAFAQAQERARAWFSRVARAEAGLQPSSEPLTVAQALDRYLEWYAGHRKALAATRRSVEAHIRPALGDTRADRLTASRIKEWHAALAAAPAKLRTSNLAKKPNLRLTKDDDAKRRRRSTANRILTILKAALNHAWRDGLLPSDDAWRRATPFKETDSPIVRYLSGAEAVRLVNACPEDFRQLVRGGLLTGCRYGELIALRARNYIADAGVLQIHTSKAGKPRHVALTDEAREFFAAACAGKSPGDLLFTRADGGPWLNAHQLRRMRDACRAAKITPAISFHVLRHTHASILAMRGVPLPVIAQQLGHADTRITSRHYAHLSPSYFSDTIRANFPTLGITDKSSIAAFKPKRQRKD